MLKVHIHESFDEGFKAALKQVLKMLLDEQKIELVDTLNEATVVIILGLRPLEQVHSHDRHFILVFGLREKIPAQVPENVVVTTMLTAVADTIKALNKLVILPIKESGDQPSVSAQAKRVLVIEDTKRHVEAARKQLGTDFNLTVVTNYRQALEAMQQPYDVVLTDLMLPASIATLSEEATGKYVGREMPLGFILVFLAAQAGTKRIGVVTDLNHHAHPMSAALDHLHQPYNVNGATVVFSNRALTKDGSKDWRQVLEDLLNKQ